MIHQNNAGFQSSHIHLNISRRSADELQIEYGLLKDTSNFSKERTILINPKDPNLLWSLLHDLIGIPKPEGRTFMDESGTTPKSPDTGLVAELQKLSSKEIVAKVEREKGVKITNSLKSKIAIINKALKIYN